MMNLSVQPIYNWYRSIIRNPKYRPWVIIGSLLYLFSPFDIAPDFLPIIGQIDDALVLTVLVSEIVQISAEKLKSRRVKVQDRTDPQTIDIEV